MKEKKFGKKQAVLALMVLLLGAAVYLNYFVASGSVGVVSVGNENATTPTHPLGESQFVNGSASTPDYFESARESRSSARQEALDILQETLQDVKLSETAQQEALLAAATVAQAVEQEDAAESLIKAKGFADCVVYLEGDACHVAVKGAELTEAQVLQITQILLAQTAADAQNIHIVTVE